MEGQETQFHESFADIEILIKQVIFHKTSKYVFRLKLHLQLGYTYIIYNL